MASIYTVEVRHEWTKTYTIRGAESEADAEAQAVAHAKEDIQEEIGEDAPSASDFETYTV